MSTRETRLKSLLAKLDIPSQPPEEKLHIKVENHAGYVHVPVGLAGPLEIQGPGFPKQTVYAPLATTEAALVASCSRGCKAINLCGGLHFEILGQGMTRVPSFKFANPGIAISFARHVPELEDEITRTAESTSRYVRLQKITPYIIGSYVHLHLGYHCGDAAGQNMVTIATQAVCDMLVKLPSMSRFQPEEHVTDLGMSSDKKPSWTNIKETRGVEVMAWGSLSNEVCQRVLGCSSESIYKLYVAYKDSTIRIGQFGCNINSSNIVAALFLATGQDVACVAEACWSHLVFEYDSDTRELTLSLYFAGLPVGVVGGGTSYATQQMWLKTLKCTGPEGKTLLAAMIASFALALDISTAAAFFNNTFAKSHQRLARGSRL